jgi:Na+/glutamate symporter
MSLTRTHIAFLGIISIFTGLVGPGTYAGDEILSYLMTDMRWLSYSILLSLILAFTLASLRKWSLYRLFVLLIILSTGMLLVFTLKGDITSSRS